MGTRISAQVRSHAQKVLKDYSPNSQYNNQRNYEDDEEGEDEVEDEDGLLNSRGESSGEVGHSDDVRRQTGQVVVQSAAGANGNNEEEGRGCGENLQSLLHHDEQKKNLPVKRLLVGTSAAPVAADYDEIQDCMLAVPPGGNLNEQQKRYRKSVAAEPLADQQNNNTSSAEEQSASGKRKRRR